MTSATSSWKSVPLVDQVARDDGEVGGAVVGGARPREPPRSRRERPDVKVGEVRDAQAVEPGVEARDVHVALDHAGPAAAHEDAVPADDEPREVRVHVHGRRQVRRALHERGRRRARRSVATTAGMSVQRHAHQWMKYGMSTSADDRRVAPRRSGMPARARPTKSSTPAAAHSDPMRAGAGQPSRRPSSATPSATGTCMSAVMPRRMRRKRDDASGPVASTRLVGVVLDFLRGAGGGQTPSSLTSVSLFVTPT